MSEEHTHNARCKSDSHIKHLCYIVSQGFHLSEPDEFKALTEDPRYKCGHCGREAHSGKNLCVPIKLP